MCLNVHVFLHVFSEICPELSKLSVPKSVQNSFDAQICRFVFYSAKCGVLTLSCQMHGKIWKLASGPFSLSVSMHNLSLCCLVSLRFNLDFFPLGHLDKNAKTFLDIVKYHQFSAQHIFSCLFCFQMKVVFQHNLRLSCLALSFYDSQIIHVFSLNTIVNTKSIALVFLFVTAQSVLTLNKISKRSRMTKRPNLNTGKVFLFVVPILWWQTSGFWKHKNRSALRTGVPLLWQQVIQYFLLIFISHFYFRWLLPLG